MKGDLYVQTVRTVQRYYHIVHESSSNFIEQVLEFSPCWQHALALLGSTSYSYIGIYVLGCFLHCPISDPILSFSFFTLLSVIYFNDVKELEEIFLAVYFCFSKFCIIYAGFKSQWNVGSRPTVKYSVHSINRL
jgi:hypothetical protein